MYSGVCCYFVLILTQTHGCSEPPETWFSWLDWWSTSDWWGFWLQGWPCPTLARGTRRNMGTHGLLYWLNQLYWVKSQGDSRHKLQLWSVGRVCAGLHPKTEDIPPAEYTGWPLQSHYWYFTSNGFYAILCVLTILHLGTPKTTLNVIIINTHINSIKKHIHI